MSKIIEFEVISPHLEETFQLVPQVMLKYESLYTSPEGEAKFFFWAEGADFQNFESALDADSTIAEYALLTKVVDRRFYRVTFTDSGRRALTYPVASDLDMIYLDITLKNGWSPIRMRIPDLEALTTYREACEERGIPFRLKRIFSESHSTEEAGAVRYGVTEAQREALRMACEFGYFSIPRESSLDEIATELDISTQALSTRLRRGHSNLIHATISFGRS